MEGESFFPPFEGAVRDRVLNLLVNANPYTFAIRAFFLTQPGVAEGFSDFADRRIRGQVLRPGNLLDVDRTPSKPLQVGDRVKSPNRVWPGSEEFGGYLLAFNPDRSWALVQWDFQPLGPLTYDPVDWLEPQVP